MSAAPKTPPSEPATITVASKKLGLLAVPKDQVITFAPGLPGFSQFSRYVLVEDPEVSPFLYLQSVDQPDLTLVVTDPVTLVAGYTLEGANGVLKELAVEDPRDRKVLVILTIPPGRPQEATANLVSPLLINMRTRQGRQVALENLPYSPKHRVFPK